MVQNIALSNLQLKQACLCTVLKLYIALFGKNDIKYCLVMVLKEDL
jgi:hypothetical protein